MQVHQPVSLPALAAVPAARPAGRRFEPADGWPVVLRRWLLLVPAVPLVSIGLAGTHGAGEVQSDAPSGWAYGLAVLAALSLLLRRHAPRLGITVAAAATAAYLLLDQPYGPIFFSAPAWAWCLTAVLPLRRALPWLAGFMAVVLAAAAPRAIDDDWRNLLALATVLGMALAAGAATGFALAARQRSEAATRAAVARRAVSEERLAMAQDVHDGIGHSLAVIALQAQVAAHVLDRNPARAKELLGTVAATSREALDGLRADLDRLRSSGPAADRRPTPGLADLPPLLDRMREGGLQLDARLDDRPVPAEVGAAAYRIVQESLTNVLRHAGTGAASVLVRRDGTLLIEVADRGTGGPVDEVEPGSGIAGMRWRAESVGGRLTAGPRDGGGFLVRAELPA